MIRFALALALLASAALAAPALAQQQAADSAAAVQGFANSGLNIRSFGGLPSLGYYDGKAWRLAPVAAAAVTMQAQGGTTLLNLVKREFLTRPVYAADFGEVCDGNFDNAAAYTAAAAYAVAQYRGLELGAGACRVNSSVPVNGALAELRGKSRYTSVVLLGFNGPAFLQTLTQNADLQQIHDLAFQSAVAAGQAYGNTRGVTITHPAGSTALWQHGSVFNVACRGMYACLELQNGMVSWTSFHNNETYDGTNPGQWSFYFSGGSGTGNSFVDDKPAHTGAASITSTPSAMARFEGAGDVGDLLFVGNHIGGVHALASVGTGVTYRQNFSFVGNQIDASSTNLIDLPTDNPFGRLTMAGNNLGGGVALVLPPISNSIIDDQLVDERRAGTASATLPNNAAAASTNLFALRTGSSNSQFYGGTSCDITVNGLISGVAPGVTRASFLVNYGPAGFGAATSAGQTQSTASSSFFSITATVANGVVTFAASYTAANGGFINDAQLRCRGGTYAVTRLL